MDSGSVWNRAIKEQILYAWASMATSVGLFETGVYGPSIVDVFGNLQMPTPMYPLISAAYSACILRPSGPKIG